MIRGAVRRTAAGAAFILLSLVGFGPRGSLAQGAATKVTVIRMIGGDVALGEVATRAWAELNAGGIRAVLLDCAGPVDTCRALPPPPGGRSIALTTFRKADETITEATLTPEGRDRPTVRRSLTVSDEAAADPKVMAIRAVELVNAMLLQIDSAAAESSAAWRLAELVDAEYPGQHVMGERPLSDRGPPEVRHWTVGAGGSFLKGAGGLSAALGFALRASYEIRDRVGVSALLTESPSLAKIATSDGTLSMNQQLAALEVTCRLYQNARFSSQLAVGGGAYHLNASWRPTPMPLPPNTLWALLLSVGGGAALSLGHEMSLFVEARAVLAAPNPVFHTTDGRALTTADPSLLLSLGLQRTF